MEALYVLILLLPLPVLLNRWRGTGDIVTFGKIGITGVMIYALYLALLIGCLSTWYYGILSAILFVVGESFAWGKWIGFLVSEDGEKEYTNTNGQNFPYIHQIANSIVKERVNYKLYCQVALAIRGMVWWTPLYLLFAFIGLTSYIEAILLSIFLGLSFPIACELSKKINIKYVSKYLVIDTNWEKQEVIYGLIQGLAFVYVLSNLLQRSV